MNSKLTTFHFIKLTAAAAATETTATTSSFSPIYNNFRYFLQCKRAASFINRRNFFFHLAKFHLQPFRQSNLEQHGVGEIYLVEFARFTHFIVMKANKKKRNKNFNLEPRIRPPPTPPPLPLPRERKRA
jgi:hypothetical protein